MPAVIILAIFLIASLIGSEGTLLCFGKDGHVAVEFVDSCNGSGAGSHLAAGDSDACGPCRDIQLPGSMACRRNSSHYAQANQLLSLPTVSSALPAYANSAKSADPLLPSLQSSTLAALQSVVLLI